MSRSDIRTSSETNAALDVVCERLGGVSRPSVVAGVAAWASTADELPEGLREAIEKADGKAHAKLSTKKARPGGNWQNNQRRAKALRVAIEALKEQP